MLLQIGKVSYREERHRNVISHVQHIQRLIHARVEPIVDPLLSRGQAGFRRRRSTVDQAVLLIQNIEDSFEAQKKAGAVFVDLTAVEWVVEQTQYQDNAMLFSFADSIHTYPSCKNHNFGPLT